jgi:acyl-CoA dehydrogenase
VERGWLDEELTLLRGAASSFLSREMVPHREAWEKAGLVDRDAWLKLGSTGFLCAGIPAEYGGAGGTYAHDLLIQEECARAGLGGGLGAGLSVHSGIVAHYILAYGTEEQKRRWLPGMASGERIGAVAMTEPGAGSDLKAIRTTARRVRNGYRLDGAKTFITNGLNADLIVAVAKTDPTAGAKGISLLMFEAGTDEGFRRGRKLEKLGMHAQDTSELFFDDVLVSADNLLGGVEGQGFGQLIEQLAWERLQLAATAAVNMEEAVNMTSAYVKERKAFGQRVFDFQNTQFKLAECATTAQIARVFIDRLIVELLDGSLTPEIAAMAKLWTTEQQCRVVDECLQLHGGYGYMMEYPIARLYADVRVSRIYGGANEIMKSIIARSL